MPNAKSCRYVFGIYNHMTHMRIHAKNHIPGSFHWSCSNKKKKWGVIWLRSLYGSYQQLYKNICLVYLVWPGSIPFSHKKLQDVPYKLQQCNGKDYLSYLISNTSVGKILLFLTGLYQIEMLNNDSSFNYEKTYDPESFPDQLESYLGSPTQF